MTKKIISKLKQIEKNCNIRILYAVESGSRAWGFVSKDSDYDVRFIYIHTPDRYLSIDEGKDYLDYPIDELLDINGWEIRKALRLLKKSNAPLLEWLYSPLVYLEELDTAEKMRNLTEKFFSPKICLYHYFHMARGHYEKYFREEKIKIKKYFYVLRPLLACKWIENNKTMAPVEFQKLLKTQVKEPLLSQEIKNLMERKELLNEFDTEGRIEIIYDFIKNQIDYFKDYIKTLNSPEQRDSKILNELFRDTLKSVWG